MATVFYIIIFTEREIVSVQRNPSAKLIKHRARAACLWTRHGSILTVGLGVNVFTKLILLFRTHTHTHTHTHTFSLSLSLSHTHTHSYSPPPLKKKRKKKQKQKNKQNISHSYGAQTTRLPYHCHSAQARINSCVNPRTQSHRATHKTGVGNALNTTVL